MRPSTLVIRGNVSKKMIEEMKIPVPIYGVNVVEFIKSNREILYSRVEQNLLSAVCEAVLVLGKDLTKALYEQAVAETLKKQDKDNQQFQNA